MAVRHFGEKSKHDDLRHIDKFLAFLGRPPETATVDDLRDFQVYLNQNGVRPSSFNSAVSALRFFFCTTLGMPEQTARYTQVATNIIREVMSPLDRLAHATADIDLRQN